MTTMGHLSVWRWKDVLLGVVLFCNFDIYCIFIFFPLYLFVYVFRYILSKVIDEAKCEVESVFHLWQNAPPSWEAGCSAACVRLIYTLISAGLSLLLSYSDRKSMPLRYDFLCIFSHLWHKTVTPIYWICLHLYKAK